MRDLSSIARLVGGMVLASIEHDYPEPRYREIPTWKIQAACHPANPNKRAKIKAARKQNRSRK